MNAPRQPGMDQSTNLVICSDPAEARRVQDQVEQHLKSLQYHDHDIFCVRLALEEALVNAIKHGNQMDRSKSVRISYRVGPDRFDIQITDEGSGFDPEEVPDPTAAENLERPTGRGLMLMRYYMSHVTFNAQGNCVHMSKVARNGRP
jgi:serine/threonine-protein kinase RsbW